VTITLDRGDFFQLLAAVRGVQVADARLALARQNQRHVLAALATRYDFTPTTQLALDDATYTVTTLPDQLAIQEP
jgi:hypothetical protein